MASPRIGVISQTRSMLRNSAAARVACGILALGLASRLSVPFWPVPVTAQTLAVLLLGVLFGPREAVMSVVGFLAAGLCGLPVFTGGSGPLYFLGPTGGYMVGFIPAAYIAGLLTQRGWGSRTVSAAAAMALADAAIFACGMAWLLKYLPPQQALVSGLAVFVPGECLKIAMATAALRAKQK